MLLLSHVSKTAHQDQEKVFR